MTLGRRAALRAAGATLICGGVASLAIGLAPLVLPPAASPHGESAAALTRSWAEPSAVATAGPVPVPTRPADDAAFAVLRIPRFGSDYSRVIAEGLSADRVLDRGAIGHYPTSVMPGAVGNFAVAGHREAAGGPLLRLPDLRIGDRVVVDTAEARYVYRVTWRGVVAPEDVAAVAPVPGHPDRVPTRRLITLQTCTPPLIDTDRYIVHGELESWRPR